MGHLCPYHFGLGPREALPGLVHCGRGWQGRGTGRPEPLLDRGHCQPSWCPQWEAKRGPLGTSWARERQAQGDITEGAAAEPNLEWGSCPPATTGPSGHLHWKGPLRMRVWRPAPAPQTSGAIPAKESRASANCPPFPAPGPFPACLSPLSSPPPEPPSQPLVRVQGRWGVGKGESSEVGQVQEVLPGW